MSIDIGSTMQELQMVLPGLGNIVLKLLIKPSINAGITLRNIKSVIGFLILTLMIILH